MILQSFLPYFKSSFPLQDIVYEERPNAKCLWSINVGTDLERNHLRRGCLQEMAVSSLSVITTIIECITSPCVLIRAHSKPVIFDLWGLSPTRNQEKSRNPVHHEMNMNIKSKDPHTQNQESLLYADPKVYQLKHDCSTHKLCRLLSNLMKSFHVLNVFAANVEKHSQNHFEVCGTNPLTNNK